MSSYVIVNGELKHYGVLGMKWGVRKNPSRAYNKAARKKQRLDMKSVKLGLKAAKAQKKATKKLYKQRDQDDYQVAMTMQYKANKLDVKSAKLKKKATKWANHMDKTFAGYTIDRVPQDTILGGRRYVYELTQREA